MAQDGPRATRLGGGSISFEEIDCSVDEGGIVAWGDQEVVTT